MKKMIIMGSLCLLIDQLIKLLVASHLVLHKSIVIISNFFSLTYTKNIGAAFSILSGNRLLLICITLMALFLIYYLIIRSDKNKNSYYLYGILYGGIIGNLVDRVFRGYVVDYLDFKIFNYDFPIFNFADICIVISIFLIIILSIKEVENGKNSN